MVIVSESTDSTLQTLKFSIRYVPTFPLTPIFWGDGQKYREVKINLIIYTSFASMMLYRLHY